MILILQAVKALWYRCDCRVWTLSGQSSVDADFTQRRIPVGFGFEAPFVDTLDTKAVSRRALDALP